MKKSHAINTMLVFITAVILFHVCIVVGLIPYEITWGGRIQNDTEMYVFEAFSIAVNILLGVLLLMKGGYIRYFISQRVVHILLWIFLVLFILNTFGNLVAKTNFEKSFAALTLLFAVLIGYILKGKE